MHKYEREREKEGGCEGGKERERAATIHGSLVGEEFNVAQRGAGVRDDDAAPRGGRGCIEDGEPSEDCAQTLALVQQECLHPKGRAVNDSVVDASALHDSKAKTRMTTMK